MNADDFLAQKELFRLGDLTTESPHPLTVTLSDLAAGDLQQALRVLRTVDLAAMRKVLALEEELAAMFESVATTLEAGHRIYLVGCGATGRLSLSLEYLWRRKNSESDQVRSLMAGGDVALVHSLEGFEDFPEFGARHLSEAGFGTNDLLIATTEGGETPYVIGATEEAARISSRRPLFLHCNPSDILSAKVERSRRVLADLRVASFALTVGPMALTGSTRMQASTALMLVVGLALEFGRDHRRAFAELKRWIEHVAAAPTDWLKDFIVREADTYGEGDHTCYTADEFAITVFTDTTERAPTFNLAPFDNPRWPSERHSLTYIALPHAQDAAAAWTQLLARVPRPLNWVDVNLKTDGDYLYSFDFSRNAVGYRTNLVPGARHHLFEIKRFDGALSFQFRGLERAEPLLGGAELFDHLQLKMLLNAHSTLLMGRMGRFEGNLMTWVYPSNGKLVDRAARYTEILLRRMGRGEFSYDDIVRAQFACKARLDPRESIVHNTIERLLSGQIRRPGSHERP